MLTAASSTQTSSGEQPNLEKVILDTDIGSSVDDAYALTLLVSLKKAKLLGVTTVSGATDRRAQLAAKLLMKLGSSDVPVYAGQISDRPMNAQIEWAHDFHSQSLKTGSAIDFLHKQIQDSPGEITLIAIGPLTNLGQLFIRHPETAQQIKRIVVMGGAVNVGYSGEPPAVPEHNIASDPVSARIVLQSGARLVMAGLDATAVVQLDEGRRKRFRSAPPLPTPCAR